MKSWKKPTNKQVSEAVALMTKTEHVRYFFDKLQNPKWLKLLREHGLFKHPPDPVEDGRYIRFPDWAQSRYLVRIAGEVPEAVFETIKQVAKLDVRNVRIQMDLIDAALRLPAGLASEIVPFAIRWLKAESYLMLPDKLGEFMSKLGREGELDAAFELAGTLLDVVRPRRGTREARSIGISPDAESLFRTYDYEEILENYLPTLTEIDGLRSLDLLSGKLEKCLLIRMGSPKEDITEDYSYIWRPAIEDQSQNHQNVKDALVNAVRDAAEWVLKNDPGMTRQVLDLIEEKPYKVFRRMALHLLRLFPEADRRRRSDRLADRQNFDDPGLRHEYYLLLHTAFAELPKRKQETIVKWMEQGPDLEDYKRYVSSSRGSPATDEEVENYKRRWQRDRLAIISEALPPRLRAYQSESVKKLGPAEPLDVARGSASWVGPTSPLTEDQVKACTVSQLIDYLRIWAPTQTHWPPSPSPEGLGRVLTAVVASNPEPYAGDAILFQGLDSTFIKSLFYGLREALKGNKLFTWDSVLSLAEWTIGQPRDHFRERGWGGDRDPHWGWARKALADLLGDGLGSQGNISFTARERVWPIIQTLARDPDPAPEDEREDSGLDPATRAINTVRGEAMHALMQYALWCARNLYPEGPKKTGSYEMMSEIPEVQAELGWHLDPKNDGSLAIRSVYGQFFPWLVLLDAAWARARATSIFSQDPSEQDLRDAAWDAYVAFCRVYDNVVPILMSEYRRAVSALLRDRLRRGFAEPDESLAEHIIVLCIRGIASLGAGGLVETFFGHATAEQRGHAIDVAGRILAGTTNPNREILDRLERLWEYRIKARRESQEKESFVQELRAFGDWYATGVFEPGWALTRFVDTLELTGGRAEIDDSVLERLLNDVSHDPKRVAEAVRLLIVGDTDGWRVAHAHEKIRGILSQILGSSDKAGREAAEGVVHMLGARGYHDFRELLTKT